jgi:hypothetical protein
MHGCISDSGRQRAGDGPEDVGMTELGWTVPGTCDPAPGVKCTPEALEYAATK